MTGSGRKGVVVERCFECIGKGHKTCICGRVKAPYVEDPEAHARFIKRIFALFGKYKQ